MPSELNSISLNEFSNNPTGFFEEVVRESKPIIVENARGERAVLKPLARGKAKGRPKTEADKQAFLSSLGAWNDVNAEQFLKDNYESRALSIRPSVEL
jgi:hypothetical protein